MHINFLKAFISGLLLTLIGTIVMFSVKQVYKIRRCCNAACPEKEKHYLFRRMFSLFISGMILSVLMDMMYIELR